MSTHSVTGYLIVKAKRNTYSPSRIVDLTSSRFVKNKPTLEENEVAVKLTVTLPDSVFNEPVATAEIKVPEQDVIRPEVVVEGEAP